jgi:hypothetical protein
MKKLQFTFLLSFLIICTLQAQDTIQHNNPLGEARFNYFKETILIFNEYLDTDSGSFNTTNLRFLHPVGNRAWNFRVDIPLISTNTTSANKTGLGDIALGVSYIPFLNHKKGIAIRAKITSNSASDPNFGSGKWVFTPTFFLGNYLGKEKKYLLLSSLENQMSFAGSSTRNKVNTTVLENTLLYFFGKNWFGTNVAFRYNATVEGFQNSSFIEYGRKITPDSMFYIHPSVAFGGAKSYNYGMELGVLILF